MLIKATYSKFILLNYPPFQRIIIPQNVSKENPQMLASMILGIHFPDRFSRFLTSVGLSRAKPRMNFFRQDVNKTRTSRVISVDVYSTRTYAIAGRVDRLAASAYPTCCNRAATAPRPRSSGQRLRVSYPHSPPGPPGRPA